MTGCGRTRVGSGSWLSTRTALAAVVAALAVLVPCRPAGAQSLEPRSYSNVPTDMHFVLAGYGYSTGDLVFDPTVPLTDASVDTHIVVVGYSRGLGLLGRSASLSIVGTYISTSGNALLSGERVSGENHGMADPLLRFAWNLYGAPALRRAEFAGWKQDLIVGFSLKVKPPLGDYERKILTIGNNRWSVKPEIGLSKAVGPWQLEFSAGVNFYTDNDDPIQGDTQSQDPVYALQGHFIRNLQGGRWFSLDVTHYQGGDVETDGVRTSGLQRSGRYGLTFSTPVSRYGDSVKFYASTGAYSRIGSDFHVFGIAWQRGWAGD